MMEKKNMEKAKYRPREVMGLLNVYHIDFEDAPALAGSPFVPLQSETTHICTESRMGKLCYIHAVQANKL